MLTRRELVRAASVAGALGLTVHNPKNHSLLPLLLEQSASAETVSD